MQNAFLKNELIQSPRSFRERNISRSSPLHKTEKRGPFRKNKTPLRGIEPFQNSTFYGAIVSNNQYSTSGGFIYSDNTNFYCIPWK